MLSSRAAAAILLVVALTACTSERSATSADGGSTGTRSPSAAPAAPTAPAFVPTAVAEGQTLVATAVVDVIEVYDSAEATTPSRTLDRREEVSGELVFVVEQEQPDRLLVQLPVRPNGTTGWVRATDVALTVHGFAVEVRLGDHELVVSNAGAEVLRAPIGVGTTDTPTPGGTYYVKELLQPPTPDGPYGAFAYGLSGFSNELSSFNGGDGVIGIHGTDRPELVGQDVSSGCIRLTNDVVTRLVEQVQLPLGTPVTIVS